MPTINRAPHTPHTPLVVKGRLSAVSVEKRRQVPHTYLFYTRALEHETRAGLIQKVTMTKGRGKPRKGKIQILDNTGRPLSKIDFREEYDVEGNKKLFLSSLETGRHFEKEGFATQLLSEAIHVARTLGEISCVELYVRADNAHAIRVYKSIGFVKEGTHFDREHLFTWGGQVALSPREKEFVTMQYHLTK